MNEKNYPPPWTLNGEGILFPFIANKKEILNSEFLTDEDKKNYHGGLGAIMLVNYHTSNVGPYFELLFIPGDFKYKNSKYKRITKIYVSSEISIREGIKNWAIPKELAHFEWKRSENKMSIQVKKAETFLSLEIEELLFPFPITTSIYPVKLLQKAKEEFLLTQFSGKGKAKISTINKFESNGLDFPDLNQISKFNICLSAFEFQITFPIPERVEYES
jgi:hypothetical protein